MVDDSYLSLCDRILTEGFKKPNRTGISAFTVAGAEIRHDMSQGFPLLTTKKVAHKSMRVELEGFIQGVTDKKWFQDRNCTIWNEWCNPKKVPYGTDEGSKMKMAQERDLGPIYGFQWRHKGAKYGKLHDNVFVHGLKWILGGFDKEAYEIDYSGRGIDQLGNLVKKLKTDPTDRRMIVDAWNPQDQPLMALPPCHYGFQVNVIDDKLNLIWHQRSVDVPLGLPFNIASYATLLHLLAHTTGFKEGELIGHLGDVHIYENQVEGIKEQMKRTPYPLPRVETVDTSCIFDWKHDKTKFIDYNSHPKIDFPLAV